MNIASIEITHITLIRGSHGPDHLIFDTKLPQGCFPFTATQYLKTDVARGHGEDWVEKNFPGVEFHKVV